jgi:1-phosphofructokinase
MIITVTLNPALDRTLVLGELKTGEVNRVTSSREDIGGKGINVSKVLSELGIPSKATGFLGNNLERFFIEELQSSGIENNFISISGNTRTNIKIVDEKKNENTDLNEAGPFISEKDLNSFYTRFETLVKENDLVVLSGGAAPGIPKDVYAVLTKKARDRGAKVIVDAEGDVLRYAIKEKPFMIKPNHQELADYCGKKTLSEEEILKEGSMLIESGIDMVLVSRGEEGSILFSKECIMIAEGRRVPVKSTVGGGDAMVAAMAYGIMSGYDLKEMFALAQASGTAAVMTEGTTAPTKSEIERFFLDATQNITFWDKKNK